MLLAMWFAGPILARQDPVGAGPAGLDSLYRGEWQGPLSLSFDSLHWQPISPSHGIVTVGFRWLAPEFPDTVQYVYLSVLERTATGLRILVEHETTLTPRQP
jgi:hypothetical protein